VLAWLSVWSEVHTCIMVQLMPLPLTVSCSSTIQIGFTFLARAHLDSPGQRAVKWVCVCVCNTISACSRQTDGRTQAHGICWASIASQGKNVQNVQTWHQNDKNESLSRCNLLFMASWVINVHYSSWPAKLRATVCLVRVKKVKVAHRGPTRLPSVGFRS